MIKTDQPIIIFDGVCNLCEYSVQFIIKHDRQARFKFASAQSESGKAVQSVCNVDTLRNGTVILLKNRKVYLKSDAAVEIARDLDGPWRFLHFLKFIPKSVRDCVYSKISKHRYQWFGKKNKCLVPDENIKNRFL